jgi:large subunit ribosomal protein L4
MTTTTKNKKAIVSLDAEVYSKDGKKVSDFSLPSEVFGLNWNADLVHQVITSLQTDARHPYAHAKTRGEVSGGGKKPWQQKGTGRARHGSRRSPIWKGGGVTFGPRNDVNRERKVNKKMKAKALFTILSRKALNNEIIFVDSISFATPKTKDASAIFTALGGVKGYEMLAKRRKNRAIVAIDENDVLTKKSFANFSNVKADEVRNLNPIDLLKYKYVIIENPEVSLKVLEAKLN